MSTIKERIEAFKDLPGHKQKLKELSLRLESLENIKSNISDDNYEELKKSLINQKNSLSIKVEDLKIQLDGLRAEIELDTKMLMSEISLLEKEVQEVQVLFQSNAISKEDYSTRIRILKRNIAKKNQIVQENFGSVKKLENYRTFIGEQNSNMFNFKDKERIGTSIPSASRNLNLPKLPGSKIAVVGVTLLLIVLLVCLLAFNKPAPYSDILPSSFSKLHLGMKLEKFHSEYSEKDYREEYNRDGSLSISFRLNKVTDYKWFNNWELEFKDKLLYSIAGTCTYTSEEEELCRLANEVYEIIKEIRHATINHNDIYPDFSDCLAYKEYFLKLKSKGMPDNYKIRIVNDLNARKWSRDPLKILIWTE